VVAALALAGGVVMRQARAQAYRMEEHRLGPRSFRFTDLPAWADRFVKSALLDPRRLALSASIFDPTAEDQVRDVLSRHPLIEDVREVRLEYPHTVSVRARLRIPVAEIPVRRLDASGRTTLEALLLSGDGRLLERRPYMTYLGGLKAPLPVITGIRGLPPRSPGQRWETLDEQVDEALAAAAVADRLAADLARSTCVVRIDVSRYPATERRADGEIRFFLDDGLEVEWGRTERALDGGEDEDVYATKLRRLKAALARRPSGLVDVRLQEDAPSAR
jgi:hypothetical protein